MTPRIAGEVLLRLAAVFPDVPDVQDAVALVTKRLSLRPGCSAVSVGIASRGAIASGAVDDAWGRPFTAFRPCWIEIEDNDHWRVERWYIDNESQPVAPLFTGHDFPTAPCGRDLIFKVRNVGGEAADFRAEMVGYGYSHPVPRLTTRRPFRRMRGDE